MPVEKSWYIPQKVLIHTYPETVCADDVLDGAQALADTLRANPENQMIHILMDGRKLQKVEVTVKELLEATKPLKGLPMGWVLFFGVENYVLRNFINIVTAIIFQVVNIRFRVFDTVEECLAFLEDVDSEFAKLLETDAA